MDRQSAHAIDLTTSQKCVNDLVSLLTLQAVWAASDRASIAQGLSDVLARILHLDFVYLRSGGTGVDLFQAAPALGLSDELLSVGEYLDQEFGDLVVNWPPSARVQMGKEEFSVAKVGLGMQCEFGVVVAGSRRDRFPEPHETVVLSLATNQAAVALQDAHRRDEQARASKGLDEQVSQRTRELAAANEELRKENARRRRMEQSLRESEINLRKIINTLPTTAWSTRADGYCDFLSDRWLEYAGLSAEEAEGWGWASCIHPDDVEPLTRYWKSCLDTGSPVDTEARIRRSDGVYRWFLFRANPLRDETGKIARWYGTNIDIEDRKNADVALAASERDLKLSIDTIPGLTWFCRADGAAEFLNKQWCDYTGLSGSEALGWNWAQAIHPDDLPHLQRRWLEALSSNRADETEARIRRFDGEYRWFLFRTNPLLDEDGNVLKWYGTNIDIEDRKRATEALRASELNLRELTETIPEMLWSATAEGAIDYCNIRFQKYTGFSNQDLMGDGWKQTIHPEDAARVGPVWMNCVATGAPYQVEVRTLHAADGTYRWCAVAALPLLDDQQRILRWHGTIVDVHDRKLAEVELLRSERDARLIVDCIPVQVAVLGPSGNVELVNRPMAEFFGRSVEELNDWRTNDWVPEEELPRVRAAMEESFATGRPFEMENRLRRFDGVYRWTQVRGYPLKDANGDIVHWYFSFVDLEERKQAEEALRRSQGFLAEAQKISSTGSFSWNLDTDELILSEELYRIFEFDRGEVVTRDRLRALVHPDDKALIDEISHQIREDSGYIEFEIRLRFADDRVKHVRVLGHMHENPNGQPECLGAVQDVTQAQKAAAALDKARSELAHVSRVMSLGALTASIAHEVNQPLSGIITNAGTCLRMLATDPPNIEGALETARRTIRDGNRAAEVIARLRQLFTKKTAAMDVFDLNEATREVLALLSMDLLRSSVILRVEIDDDEPALVMGDRVQLQQVILNLVRNAADAMRNVHDRARDLLVRVYGEGGEVTFLVKDAGTGFDAKETGRLFDAFYTTKNDGMGIGLSVSRTIVEGHGGEILAGPNDGPGATFRFSIKRAVTPDQRRTVGVAFTNASTAMGQA